MKKKIFKNVSIISSLFILASCGILFDSEDETTDNSNQEDTNEQTTETEENEPEENEFEVTQDLTAWIPRLENVVYEYEGINNEYAEFIFTPQFNEEDYYQFVTDNGGTTMAEIYEYQENEIVQIFSRPETYFRDNFIEIGLPDEYKEDEVILKQPIEEGTKWSGEEDEYEITDTSAEVEVPEGTYSAIEVTIKHEDATTKRYYAEDVGLVHEIYEAEEMTVESKLENIKEDTVEELPFNVYIPGPEAIGMDIVDAQLELETNAPARKAINELLLGQDEDFEEAKILPDDTIINYLFLNEENIVEVDLSKEFVENMNAGSTGELFTVYTLVNTLADYYGSEEVLLTVEEKPYEGAHMTLEEGETLDFEYEMMDE